MGGDPQGFDAIAVGGGLAGAAFALELARSGARVLVLERTRQATLKVCGDFLSAEAIGLLAALGLDAGSFGASPVERFTFATGRRAAHAELPFRAAGLSRLVLDEALLALAERAGATVERGVTVSRLSAEDGGIAIAAAERRFSAPVAALATGKHNLRGWPRDPGAVTGFKMQFALSPAARAELLGRVQLVLFDGGFIGASLVEGGLATLCWELEPDALRRIGADWRTQLAAISSGSDFVGDLLAGAEPASARPATIAGLPFGYVRRAAIGDAVYPVGDQLAVIHAFTGDGTSLALASGVAAARAVLSGEGASRFQARLVGLLRRQFAVARTLDVLFRTGTRRRLAVGAMALMPAVASRLAGATRLNAALRPEVS